MPRSCILLALFTAILSAACSHEDPRPAKGAPTRTVDAPVVVVERTSMPEFVDAGGVIRARATAEITSRIVAPVEAVLVSAGDRVRRGQVLARLDGRDLAAAARRAVSGRQAAEQASHATNAEREAAHAALDLARATHTRLVTLHDRRSATEAELDAAVASLREAGARAAATEARAAEAAAALGAAAAGEDAAAVTAGWATIVSPFDGLVTEKLVEAGNTSSPGMPLFRIEERDGLRLEVRLDESRAAFVRIGQDLEVQADAPVAGALASTAIRGRVAEIARAADAGAHAFLLKIDLPPGTAVPSGTYARVRIPGAVRQVLSVPSDAVLHNGQVASVYAVEGDRARLRLVSTGSEYAGRVEILAGLDAGERVVGAITASLADGVRLAGAAR